MTDAVLIAVIITIAILAFGGISVLVILLFMKWKGYMKTRNRRNTLLYHIGQEAIENVHAIDECGSKIARNRAFDCRLSPDWRQMAIENTVSSDL